MFFFLSCLSVSLLSLLVVFCHAQTEVANTTFQVGVILDFDSVIGRIGLNSLSLALSDFYSVNANYTTKLVLHARDSRGQVIDAAASALSLLKDVEVDAIIGPQNSEQASFVIGLGDRVNVPIISFSATSPAPGYPPTSYFVRTALSDSAQVDAIAAITKHFQWSQVVLVYEDSHYGNGIIPYLFHALQDVNAQVSYRSIIPQTATDEILRQEIYKMKTTQTRIFVVHMSTSLASRFFPKVKQAGMMVEGYAWIVTSGLMDLLYSMDPDVIETMQGVLGVKPLTPRSRKLSFTATRWKKKFLHDNPDILQAELSLYGLWAYDTLWALAMVAERVGFREPPSSLQNTSVLNSTNMFSTKISQTGPKLLEAMSDVVFEGLGGKFHLVDGQLERSSFQILNVVGNGEREVGIWTPQGILNMNVTSSEKMKSIIFPGDTTIVPKGWKVPVSNKKLRIAVPTEPGFTEFIKVEKELQTNASRLTGCYIDIFDAVMAALSYAVAYEYVPFEKPDGSSAGSYDEITYQVFLQNYDAAVGDITITYKRLKYVDFALPFTGGGVSMVVPITNDHPDNKWIFLKPLKKNCGERIVSNLGRLVVVVWVFVVLILSSTYTASLSSILTAQRLKPAVTNVEELIRNGDYVGCHKGSFIVDLLQDLGFDKLKIMTYEHPSDCEKALSKGSENGGISALFAVMPYTNLFLSNYCHKYTTVGPTYPTEGFAYVFPKGSPLVADVSRAVIELTENGRIPEIERKWMKNVACNGPDGTGTSTSISLQSFNTLFGITGGITATCLVIFLVSYLYKNRDSVKRILSSNTTIWSKTCAMFKHFDERDPKSFRAKLEDGESSVPNSNLCVNTRTSTVVPVTSEEMGDVNTEQHTLAIPPP
ncbi:hypothetical protein DH2020_038115 [Rehmannia glutinosa]|uniref:Glutamate receptor n=1 Tax=Rehmannia glutinosa TaxID=99300 RepID=A0ABR0V0R9_REHGL